MSSRENVMLVVVVLAFFMALAALIVALTRPTTASTHILADNLEPIIIEGGQSQDVFNLQANKFKFNNTRFGATNTNIQARLPANYVQIGNVIRLRIVFVTKPGDVLPFASIYNVIFTIGLQPNTTLLSSNFPSITAGSYILEVDFLFNSLSTVNIESIQSSTGSWALITGSNIPFATNIDQIFTLTASVDVGILEIDELLFIIIQ